MYLTIEATWLQNEQPEHETFAALGEATEDYMAELSAQAEPEFIDPLDEPVNEHTI